ncbi:MAG: hypothetical protein HOD97_06460 [Candidatus Marinimicrobia bacterium]|nr:hypothetical protein [Candidatus Neomarinimicrobiota bacterium]MBT3617171.1 hypothetical protein [Candidatus Neomarinimicrobiota bacterium]MBT3829792.1 hypothetical protein [Candidatus Neomarinimicrobiota bacterium]MBT3997861.1 hypothetical protein [Candidatus Neomarinimicrobiota bacterium]MBT4281239.1 hypothetical protein [Candidatus Neomarinimicrobiota bacterium]
MIHIDWRLRLFLALVLLVGAIALVYFGYTLKELGQKFSHIWMGAAVAGWGGAHHLQKAFEDKP